MNCKGWAQVSGKTPFALIPRRVARHRGARAACLTTSPGWSTASPWWATSYSPSLEGLVVCFVVYDKSSGASWLVRVGGLRQVVRRRRGG